MTTEDRHEWATERLSDYMDGTLPLAEAERVKRHLAGCPDCSALRSELGAVVAAGRALGPIEPSRDLWPGIAAGIGVNRAGHGAGPSITTLRTSERRARGKARASRSSWPWSSRTLLAAAAVVLVTVSASLAWWGRGAVMSPVDSASTGLSGLGSVRPAATPAQASLSASLAQELQELEAMFGVMRERLDPGTVEVLERNLLLIERAIEDSYQALALDPENDFVREHLERTHERKRDTLREVSRLTELAG